MGGNGQPDTMATLRPGKSRCNPIGWFGTRAGRSGRFLRREKFVVPADIRTLIHPARSLVAIRTAYEQQVNRITVTCYESRICLQGRSVRRNPIPVDHVLLK